MNRIHLFSLTVFLLCVLLRSEAKRVLLLPHLQPSHVNEHRVVGSELVRRGHEVYIVLAETSHKIKFDGTGITVLWFESSADDILFDSEELSVWMSESAFAGSFSIERVKEATALHCQLLMNDDRLLNSLKTLDFDYAIVDTFFMDMCLLVVPEYLGIPFSSLSLSLSLSKMGIPELPSFGPLRFFALPQKVNLLQRLQMFCMTCIMNTAEGFFLNRNETFLKIYAPRSVSWDELLKKSELFIIPVSFSALYPFLSLPNVIRTNGIAFRDAKTLTKDWGNVILGRDPFASARHI